MGFSSYLTEWPAGSRPKRTECWEEPNGESRSKVRRTADPAVRAALLDSVVASEAVPTVPMVVGESASRWWST